MKWKLLWSKTTEIGKTALGIKEQTTLDLDLKFDLQLKERIWF